MGSRSPWILMVGLAGVAIVFGAIWWMDNRGIGVGRAACAWDSEHQRYAVDVSIRNQESVFKIVRVMIQGRFRPLRGRAWPHPMLRTQYEAMTQRSAIALEPYATAEQYVEFQLPGVEDFACSVHVKVAGQERFAERPSQAVLDALSSATP